MASVPAIECPLTPELDQCPVTPESRSADNERPPQQSSPSAPSEGSERQASPPPNCAICLGRCVNKCFTDNCMHKFCFSCLMEWSKIKAECPLCKKPFRSIIHNVKSLSQFDEYIVNQPSRPRPQPRLHRLNVILSDRPRYRYRTTFQVNPNENEAIQQLFLHQSNDLRAADQALYDQWLPPRSINNRSRRQVYETRMFSQPLYDINGRDRICSAEYYRENPAQVHRLMPWIRREILALTNNVRADFIIHIIHDMLTQHDIVAPQFFAALEPHLLNRTAHFIHELNTFARGPYDIYGFDRYVRYSAPVEESVVISTEDSSEGEDNVSFMTRRGRTEFTIETRSNVSTVILTGSFRCPPAAGNVNNSNVGVIDISNTSNDAANVAGSSSGSNGDSISIVDDTNEITPAQQQVSYIESLTDSDSDECMFVREQKPPHLRTPEYIELNSEDEDSDVVFVDDALESSIQLPPKKRARVEIDCIPNLLEEENASTNSTIKTSTPSMKIESQAGPSSSSENMASQPSTSSGITDAKSNTRKKYYAEPVRRHNRMQKNANKIFDPSSSSASSPESFSESSSSSVVNIPPAYTRTTNTSPTPSISSSFSSSSHEEYKVYTSAKRKKQSSTKRKIVSPRKRSSRSKIRSKLKSKKLVSTSSTSVHRKKDINKYSKATKLKSVFHKQYENQTTDEVTGASINDDCCEDVATTGSSSSLPADESSAETHVREVGAIETASATSISTDSVHCEISSIVNNNNSELNNNDDTETSISSSSRSSPLPGSSRNLTKRKHKSSTNVYISHCNKSSASSTSSSSSSSTSSSEESNF